MENSKSNRPEVVKIIGINVVLFILLFGLILINKTVFRPICNNSQFFQVLTGSFPNFIAVLLISLCIVNPVLVKKPKYGRHIVYLLSLGVMLMLIFEEITSVWEASTQYDIYDIIGSILGSFFAILIFEYLFYKQKNNKIVRIE